MSRFVTCVSLSERSSLREIIIDGLLIASAL